MTEIEVEQRVVELLMEAWNLFQELPNEHPMDNLEFAHAIHQAQYLVLARPARRNLNDLVGPDKNRCEL